MTAIEELREKLDELGIEWDVMPHPDVADHSVTYKSIGIHWVAIENTIGSMLSITNYKEELSVEQVIRATIGEETTSTYDGKDGELMPCPFCGSEALTISVDGGIMPDFLSIDEKVKISSEKKYVTTCTVTCDSCGASVQGYSAKKDNTTDITDDAKADCFKKWNGRAGKWA